MPEEQDRLGELEKKLYKKNSEFEKRPEGPEAFEAGKGLRPERKEEMWQPELAKGPIAPKTKKKIIIFSIIGFVVVAAIVGAVIYFSYNSFIKTDVQLKISGPQEIVSGADASYDLSIANKTKVVLKGAKLTFIFPDDSESTAGAVVATDVGDVSPNQEKRFKFDARIFGAKDEVKKLTARLSYTPENINSPFENVTEFDAKIVLVPIFFSFNLPQRAASGKDFEMSLNVINNSDANFANTQISINYPDGYQFESSDLPPTFSNNTWLFDNLGPNEQKTIKIKGTINGAGGEIKNFVANLGKLKDRTTFLSYIQEQAGVKISTSLLVVFTTANNSRETSISAGDTLNYKINYKNTTDVNLGNVTVSAKLDSRIVDLSSLTINFGYYDARQGTIIWNSASVPDFSVLAPQKEGELTFSVKVKPSFPVKIAGDKNFTVRSIVSISASNVPDVYFGVPVGNEDDLELKSNSILQLNAVAYYKNSTIPNSGPIPPKVGSKTTYTIFWRVINYSNDLSNVSVEAVLPPGVIWQDKSLPSAENLSYDQSTGKVRWQMGNLNAGAGIISPVRQVVFQVAIIPSPSQVGGELPLMAPAQISANDLFTNVQLSAQTNQITTNLPNDPSVGYGGGYVAQ